MKTKVDTITIKMVGTKKFRQKIIDLIYAALMDEHLQFDGTKPGNGFDLDSTIAPSEVNE
jgi:hypothetical protein